MKNLILLSILFLAGILFLACEDKDKANDEAVDKTADTTPVMSKADSVKRGEYLVTIMGCHDCHSPKVMTDHGPEPDRSKYFSGHPAAEVLPKFTDKALLTSGQAILLNGGITAFTGPWGTSFAANLTPHETGIGNWTFENFERALREGKAKGLANGRMILPPMPWPNFRNVTDEDLMIMWLYFRSLPPIDNLVPAPLPPA